MSEAREVGAAGFAVVAPRVLTRRGSLVSVLRLPALGLLFGRYSAIIADGFIADHTHGVNT